MPNPPMEQSQQIPANYYNDEIDLRELFYKIWNRKIWVLAIAFAVTVLAIIYALNVVPVYQVSSDIKPATAGQIIDLQGIQEEFGINVSNSGLEQLLAPNSRKVKNDLADLTPDEVFFRFLNVLQSSQLQRQIFNEFILPSSDADGLNEIELDALFEKFQQDFNLISPTQKKNENYKSDTYSIRYLSTDTNLAVSVVNELVSSSMTRARADLIDELETNRLYRIAELDKSILRKIKSEKALRENQIILLEEEKQLQIKIKEDELTVALNTLNDERTGRILSLNEAIQIAKKLNIQTPESLLAEKVNLETVVSSESPLYLRGIKLLQAELDALQNRKNLEMNNPVIHNLKADLGGLRFSREIETLKARNNDEAFIGIQLQPLKEELNALQSIDSDYPNMGVAQVDQLATKPIYPIKPNKKLIVVLAGILGLMLGLFIALVVPTPKAKLD